MYKSTSSGLHSFWKAKALFPCLLKKVFVIIIKCVYDIQEVTSGCSSSVERELPKLERRVRFPSSAFRSGICCISRFLFLKVDKYDMIKKKVRTN